MQGVGDTTKIVFLLVFLSGFLGGDMMIYHQEDKHPYIRLDVCIQADMRMLRFKLQDYIASFSIMMPKRKTRSAPWKTRRKNANPHS